MIIKLRAKNQALKEKFSEKFSKVKSFISGHWYNFYVNIHNKFRNGKKKKEATITVGRKKELIFYWLVLALPLLHFVVFYIGVNINSILLAFQTYKIDENGIGRLVFSGSENFSKFIIDFIQASKLKKMALNSLWVYFCGLIAGVPLSLFFSYFIYKKFKGSGLFKIMLFLPSIISSVVTVLMYKYISDVGVMELFSFFGVDIMPPSANNTIQLNLIIFYNIFCGFGISTLMYSSAMTRIPESIVESAALEGCSPLREFISITLPMIYSTITTFLVVGIASIFVNQANIFTFYGLSADESIYTFGYYLFYLIRKYDNLSQYPYAAAAGLIFTVIAVPLTLIAKWLFEKFGYDTEY